MSEGARPNVVVIGAVVGILSLAGVQYYTISSLGAVESRLAQVQAEQAKAKDMIDAEIEKVRGASEDSASEREKALATVREEMEKARAQAQGIAGRVKEEAQKSVQELNARVVANEQKIRESQAQVATELKGIQQDTNTTIAAVTTEVKAVKEQVASTQGMLDSTIADLKRVNGDLGIMSGLIATNGKEIDALRQLGDRNYAEFTVLKSKNPVRVGDVWVLLKEVNPGRNRYSIELRADDRRIEKKDRGLNEPVQFYVGRNRQPHELVVNQVQKNKIVGYLATPKVTASR